MKNKPLHFNIPQIKVMLTRAQKNYFVMSRGTGKTTGILSPWYVDSIRQMPRSQGGMVAATFQQLLVRTLPPVIAGWERMGYKKDVHFVIGREPSLKWKKMWNWQPPRTKPLDSKYVIYWYNGAVQILISQDRVGSSNGLSLAYIGGDEAKLLNKERLDEEVMPTLRGDRSFFGHLPSYQGECFTTDMPTTTKAMWILEKEQLMDPEKIKVIQEGQMYVNLLRQEYQTAKGERRLELEKKIKYFNNKLAKLRKGTTYFAMANVYDNIDVLGEDYIKNQEEALPPLKFKTSILNQLLLKVEGGFYPFLDEDVHGAEWFNYTYLENFISNPELAAKKGNDWRSDSGFDKNRPLDIGMDYGAHINALVVGQDMGDEYRLLNSFYVLYPELVGAVVKKFCQYYEGYPTKEVNYFYDHTAIAESGSTDMNYRDIVVQEFEKQGWFVNQYYVGRAPSHDTQYEFWGLLLQESDPRLPKFRYSKTRANQAYVSMAGTKVKKGRNGYEKDKSMERDPNAKQENAPHIGDAVGTLVFFRLHERLSEHSSFIPNSM